MTIKTDEHGYMREVLSSNGENISDKILEIKIEATGREPKPKVQMQMRLDNADLEIDIDNVIVSANLSASFLAMSEDERKNFIDLINKSGILDDYCYKEYKE